MKQRVEAALNRLRHQDSFLIETNTNERTISHKLAEYLQEEFPDWNVDCEYNRHGDEVKTLKVPSDSINWDDTEAKTVFPDIVVHRRNSDRSGDNLVVVEVKKSSNQESRRFDKNKLIAFTRPPYRYCFGLLLDVSTDSNQDDLEWYRNGSALDE